MGKAGRRKKNRQKRKEQQDPLLGDSAPLSSPIANPQSAVHRLRHADPKTRHAALVALQASVLSQIRCGGGSKQVSMKVLQAVREQVTSSDLECSAVAAECLAQYLSASASSNNNNDQQKQTTASWALVLLGRLEDCRKALTEQSQQHVLPQKQVSKNQLKKAEKIKKQWYSIAAPCFISLCHLIEGNGYALDQINLQKKTFVEVVFGLLALCLHKLETESSTENDMEMKDTDEEKSSRKKDDLFEDFRNTTELYAARSLHSALDDNFELGEVLQSSSSRSAWMALLGGSEGKEITVTTRLHLIGCLVNLYQLSLQIEGSGSWPEQLLIEYGLRSDGTDENQGLLTQVLLCKENQPEHFHASLSNLEAEYRRAYALMENQRKDQQLEAEVDAKVRERKEPAKQIARRQKKVKEAKREAFREKQKAKMIAEAEASANDEEMMDAEDNENHSEEEEHKGILVREQNGEDAVSEALIEWTKMTGQVQLALEILANLVSSWIKGPEEQQAQSKLLQLVQSIDASSKLTDMLKTLCRFLKEGKVNAEDGKPSNQYEGYETDDPIRTDLEEAIGKVSACLINFILSRTIPNQIGSLWESLLRDVHSEINGDSAVQTAMVDVYTSILVVVMEANPQIVCEKKEGKHRFHDYISLFRQLLPRQDAVTLIATTILGLVSTNGTAEPTTLAIVKSVTEDLMVLLTEKMCGKNDEDKNTVANTQTQVLKTFMDWYGNDSFFPQLYNELQVSKKISSCLVSISSEIQNLSIDEVQMGILHNSERFVEYKKNLQ